MDYVIEKNGHEWLRLPSTTPLEQVELIARRCVIEGTEEQPNERCIVEVVLVPSRPPQESN